MYNVVFSVTKTGKVEHKFEEQFSVKDVNKIWLELRDVMYVMLDYFINRVDK